MTIPYVTTDLGHPVRYSAKSDPTVKPCLNSACSTVFVSLHKRYSKNDKVKDGK